MQNGTLLDIAEEHGYQILITTDQGIRYQQNLDGRQLAILVLLSTSWPRIQTRIDDILETVSRLNPVDYDELAV